MPSTSQRHRLGNKSLSRPTAHRLLMLRNLVSSLLQHESITTTVAKAKETQKLAEQVIGWGKRGGKSNWDRANSYLLVSFTIHPPRRLAHAIDCRTQR
jgi:large subunit ribosomal protein L17